MKILQVEPCNFEPLGKLCIKHEVEYATVRVANCYPCLVLSMAMSRIAALCYRKLAHLIVLDIEITKMEDLSILQLMPTELPAIFKFDEGKLVAGWAGLEMDMRHEQIDNMLVEIFSNENKILT